MPGICRSLGFMLNSLSPVKNKSVISHLGSCWCWSCACRGRSAGSSSSRLWPTPWRRSWASWCGARRCSCPAPPWTLAPLWYYSLQDTKEWHFSVCNVIDTFIFHTFTLEMQDTALTWMSTSCLFLQPLILRERMYNRTITQVWWGSCWDALKQTHMSCTHRSQFASAW